MFQQEQSNKDELNKFETVGHQQRSSAKLNNLAKRFIAHLKLKFSASLVVHVPTNYYSRLTLLRVDDSLGYIQAELILLLYLLISQTIYLYFY